ncbi:hypothetical protein SAMN05216483_4124 [Streptomyces sp. 2131.1]|uniref:hypothetical protein n=1 Tax=Streptomyces sp. 2131.1 TaxID=1855346 RepID=UPI0008951C39|nr:hypothetical protein [Streptomyces sp. 2131.1]SED59195.1 hypothetical protein SAMN05216483_4124 [Streptomyces sp. 2131.1]
MTPHRRTWKELPSDITAAHRSLVTALRDVRQCSPRRQADIARDAHQEPTTLSNHLNAGRIPEETLLRDFYAVVERDASASGYGALPHTLDALLELRTHAKKKHCECCTVGYPAAPEQHEQQPASPAVANPELARARRLRRRARRREIALPQKRGGAPVPLAEGDRRTTDAAELTWPETEVVAGYLADGRKHDAGFLLWQAGASYSAPDIVQAVGSCRTAGLDEAAEAILINVAERTDRQAVLNIAAALDDAGRHKDVMFILAAATRSPR